MSDKQPKKAMLGPTVQDISMKRRLAKIHKTAALNLRDAIRGGRYMLALYPIDENGNLMFPEGQCHLADVPFDLMPEIVGQFKEYMRSQLAKRPKPEDDKKGPLQILDAVVSEHTPPENLEPEEEADEQPVDPAE